MAEKKQLNPVLKLVLDIGSTAFALMLPVLGGYIAYSIAGKPGLVAGFIGDVFGVVRGLIPAMRLLTSFIYAFAGLSMVMFLYAFHKAHS